MAICCMGNFEPFDVFAAFFDKIKFDFIQNNTLDDAKIKENLEIFCTHIRL